MQLSGPRSRLSEPSALGPVQRPPDRRLRQTEYTRYCRHGFPPVQSGGHIVVSRTWVGVRGARVRAVWKRSACYHHVLFVCIYGLLYRESGAPRAQAKEGALVRRSRRQLRGARGVDVRPPWRHGQPALTHGGRARDGGTSMYTYSRANPVPAPPPRLPPAAASPHCSFLASASAAASGFSSLYLSSGESSPRTAAVSSDERMQAGTRYSSAGCAESKKCITPTVSPSPAT
mmetsp:Transcript_31322/g.102578  ORF Transcript_31322/g.102578 Transcript_31322/m.102578 type:complete len:231 (-) Transcript_31322:468-1160(-)